MKLTTSFTIINNSLNDAWKNHNLNYEIQKGTPNKYWDEECISHPTNSHCKIFDD